MQREIQKSAEVQREMHREVQNSMQNSREIGAEMTRAGLNAASKIGHQTIEAYRQCAVLQADNTDQILARYRSALPDLLPDITDLFRGSEE